MRRRCFGPVFLFILCITGVAQNTPPAPQTTALQTDEASYLAARQQTMLLRVEGDPSFHLHATIKSFDDGGKEVDGAYDEIWISPEEWRRETTIGDFHSAYLKTGGKLYRLTPDVPSPSEAQLVALIVSNPLPSAHLQLTMQTVSLDGYDLVRLGALPLKGKQISVPDEAWYFLADKNALLMRTVGFESLNFTRKGMFTGKIVLLDCTVKKSRRIVLEFKTDSMTSTTEPESAAALTIPQNAQPVTSLGPITVASAMMLGRKIGGSDPIYPIDAKQSHVQGVVLLSAVIGKDGAIHDLHAISSPSASLTGAAMDAVRTWRYKPFSVDGQSMDVRTEIQVNFTFGLR